MYAAAQPTETLLELFTRYNQDLWPLHVPAYLLGVVLVVVLVRRPGATSGPVISLILGGLWIWLGVVFQGLYAADVSAVLGGVYAALFVAQGVLLVDAGLRGRLLYVSGAGTAGHRIGWAALAYGLLVYPLIGIALGHGWPEAPLFGMAPCPTTIVTFGVLLLARPAPPRRLLVVPLVWAVLAPLAAVGRGVWEDLGLVVFGLAAAVVVLHGGGLSRAADRVDRKLADAEAAGPSGPVQ